MTRWVTFVIFLAALIAGAQEVEIRLRLPVCPGVFYPAGVEQLRAIVQQYVNEAVVPEASGRLAAIVVPQSTYSYSGAVAAHAYKYLQPGQYDRVILITPSNFAAFRGLSIPAANFFMTPLGGISMDERAIRKLTLSSLIEARDLSYDNRKYAIGKRVAIHEREYGDEVQAPFLQEQLKTFEIVPIVVGEFIDYRKRLDRQALDEVCSRLREVIDDRTLIVVSTDLTRYGEKFGFKPFTEDVLANIEKLDKAIIDALFSLETNELLRVVSESHDPVNGTIALMILMNVLPATARGELLKYDTSGRIKGEPSISSVSYAAIAFFDPTRPPPVAHPLPTAALIEDSESQAKGQEEPDAARTQ